MALKGAEWHGAGCTPRVRAMKAEHARWLKRHRERCEKILRELRREERRAPRDYGALKALRDLLGALFGRSR